ncbi:MAG TPA: Hpt domain-containing protein, partial [Desulfomonilia bacterium]|nr:Hpt domain-containing protein [Desulfomonilia bacterium]
LGKSRRRTPIIAMTGHAIQGFKERCFEVGMDDFLTKPVKRDDLTTMVKKWISPCCEDVAPVMTGAQSMKSVLSMPEDDHSPINVEQILEEFDGDKEFLKKLIKEFMDKVKEQIGCMKKAVSEGNAQVVKEEAHSIKGGASNLTAMDLSKSALDLERIVNAGLMEGSLEALVRLEQEYEKLAAFARRF